MSNVNPGRLVRVDQSDRSEGAMLFRAYWVEKTINKEEYERSNAQLTAVQCQHDRPWNFPVPPVDAQLYIEGRTKGGAEYEYRGAKRLGEWRHMAVQAIDHNSHELGHFLWCLEKISEKYVTERRILNRLVELFGRAETHSEWLKRALFVEKIDAIARENAKKGAQ